MATICKLCLQDKPLLKKSHIAPNFLYKELRDEKNTFIKGRLSDKKAQTVQSGFYEPNLFCKECDNEILSRLENYASKVLYGGSIKGLTLHREINQHGVDSVVCNGVDYTKFKLFLLSLLWRFSISSDDFYSHVDLGEHEEIIRKMILNNDAGEAMDYPCAITSYRNHPDLPIQIMSQPLKHTHDGCICYSFVMCGVLYNFYITKSLIPDFIPELAITEAGQQRVVQMPREAAIKLIRKYMGLKVNND